MSSDWTSGKPALIIVANCRVKITMSRVRMPLRLRLMLSCLGCSRTFTTIIFCCLMCLSTSSREGTSSVPFRIWPVVAFRAVYSKTGIRGLLVASSGGRPDGRLGFSIGAHLLLLERRLAAHAHQLVGVARGAQAFLERDFPAHVELEQ